MDTYLKRILAIRSLAWAECTVAPSEAFAKELRKLTPANVQAIHHGFNREGFFRDQRPLPPEIQTKLDAAGQSVRLLFVSHYNYYRNFETLFRAIPILQQKLGPRQIRLFLTCNLATDKNPGTYRADKAAALVRQLKISEDVEELGAVPYALLHQLYRSCDIYVTAAYAETFAHPLVEAMASGLPIVASDLDVHREVCGEAALYFPRFSPDQLASQILKIVGSKTARESLAAKALARSQHFSWQSHVDQVLALAHSLLAS
jgi:glycosyltransferase involved in cell wall biosynthesis